MNLMHTHIINYPMIYVLLGSASNNVLARHAFTLLFTKVTSIDCVWWCGNVFRSKLPVTLPRSSIHSNHNYSKSRHMWPFISIRVDSACVGGLAASKNDDEFRSLYPTNS
jgi:hypothetical protein